VTGSLVRALALAALLLALAGCGGGGGGGESSGGSSSDPSSQNYDPAETTLKDAGLEVCSEVQGEAVHGLDSGAGVIAVRSFDVAPDCKGAKTSPNQITIYQFNGRESLDAGLPKLKAAYPKGEVMEYGAVVIVATGPDAAENMAAVKKALPAAPTTTSTS
jgi:hypothetical protein